MRPGERRSRDAEAGFTYLGVLVLIALIGLLLALAGEVASTSMRRERETELLFIGHQYRDAIRRYFRQNHRYPPTLATLVDAPPVAESAAPVLPLVRYLRRLYRDPMTRQVDWILLLAPDQGIVGIASSSTQAPLKRAGFDDIDYKFDEALSYGDWTFVADPRTPVMSRVSAATLINASP